MPSRPSPLAFDRRAFLWGAASASAGLALLGCSSGCNSGDDRPSRSSPNPYLADNFAPVDTELTSSKLVVRGHIPAALSGSFLRNGPNPIEVADPQRHGWFVGDGMLHIVELRDGQALTYRNRYLRTNSVANQLGEQHIPGAPAGIVDVSNTHVLALGSRLLSLNEAALPLEISAQGQTLQRLDFGGALSHGLSAHCKIDPLAKELHNVSHRPGQAPFAVWQVFGAEGQLLRNLPIAVPAEGLWHTFSITDKYVLIYDVPVQFSVARAQQGWTFPYAWNPTATPRLGLIERATGDRVTWLEMPPGAVNHDIGAHDTPSGPVVYVTHSERLYDRDAAGPLEAPPRLVKLEVQVAANKVQQTILDERAQEFPRAHPGLGLGAARFVYTVGAGPGKKGGGVLELGNAILKHDLLHQTTEVARMGPRRATAEAVFVPDPARSAAEDGGWLLSYVYDADRDRSDLVITDAQDLAGDAVATIELPARIPFGFHGTWLPVG